MSKPPASTPTWLSLAQVKMMHAETIRLFGGLPGLRDEGLLESALGVPVHLWTYEDQPSRFRLAAAYAHAIARNHPFLDGNKRTALLAIRAFLFLNGVHFNPGEVETVTMMEGLAAGEVNAEQLSTWIEANSVSRRG